MFRSVLLVITAIIGVTLSSASLADSETEREVLSRLLHELQAIEVLIAKAEKQQENDTRIRFRYDWLRQDINRIKAGIRAHINTPRSTPRTFPPLRGD